MGFVCPVCGYPGMRFPPADEHICPCCGTEFGYDDFTLSHADLRKEWRVGGYQWFSSSIAPPPHWNPVQQLLNAGFDYVVSHIDADDDNKEPSSNIRLRFGPDVLSSSPPLSISLM
jgi:hypothetical protein